MSNSLKDKYVKRTQKDYAMSFKLGVVTEVERGLLTVTEAKRKYGIQGRSTVLQVEHADKKSIIFDMMIDIC